MTFPGEINCFFNADYFHVPPISRTTAYKYIGLLEA